MTHEELEEYAVKLGNALSYESYTVGDGSKGVADAIKILTTYRAQVLEEKLHELQSKIDNVTYAPKKPSDYRAWQDGFMEAYQQARKVTHPTN